MIISIATAVRLVAASAAFTFGGAAALAAPTPTPIPTTSETSASNADFPRIVREHPGLVEWIIAHQSELRSEPPSFKRTPIAGVDGDRFAKLDVRQRARLVAVHTGKDCNGFVFSVKNQGGTAVGHFLVRVLYYRFDATLDEHKVEVTGLAPNESKEFVLAGGNFKSWEIRLDDAHAVDDAGAYSSGKLYEHVFAGPYSTCIQ